MVEVPLELFDSDEAYEVVQRSIITPKATKEEPNPTPIQTAFIVGDTLYLPVAAGVEFLRQAKRPLEFDTHHGIILDDWPEPVTPNDELVQGQTKFFDDLYAELRTEVTAMAVAPTGSGKTIAGLNAIARLRCRSAVVCPTVEIARQWRQKAITIAGFSEEQVGLIGDGNKQHGTHITCTTVHSYINLADEFLEAEYGLTIWDEVHRMGARWFSESMTKCRSHRRLGLTATPSRRDGCMPVILYHFGPASVIAQGVDAEPCFVVTVPCKASQQMLAVRHLDNRNVMVKTASKNPNKNRAIVTIAGYAWESGRDVLILSDYIDHLDELWSMLVMAGLPDEDIGMFTRQIPARRYRGRRKLKTQSRVTQNKEELQSVRDHAKIILATYGMAKEGFDCPRLSVGIEATPRADATQATGRIRRPYPNKPEPKWFTFYEPEIPMFRAFLNCRLKEWTADSNIIIDNECIIY